MTLTASLYPSVGARLDNLRAAVASDALPPAVRARRMARIACLEDEAVEAPGDLAAAAPALERWRREVMANAENARPLELAAAWELTALEFERIGDTWGAERARHHAGAAICRP